MEKKMETTIYRILRLYWDSGKGNAIYFVMICICQHASDGDWTPCSVTFVVPEEL